MNTSWPGKSRWRAALFTAAFECGLMLSAGLVVAAAYAITEPAARDYAPTAHARAKTQSALETAIRQAAPHDPQRLRDFLISAIDSGEFALARGVMLSHSDPSRSDNERLHSFVRVLPPASQEALRVAQEEAEASTAPRRAAMVITPNSQSGVHAYAAESLRALATQATRWRDGQPVDEFSFMLTGLDLALAREHDAIQVLRLARRAGRLDPAYEAHWRAQLAQALPPARLRQELAQALAAQADPLIPIEVPQAFRDALEPRTAQKLLAELSTLSAIQTGVGAPGALVLIQHVHQPMDAVRLHLAALSGGDRATALALLGGRIALLRATQGDLRMTPPLRAIIALLIASLVAMTFGGVGSMASALAALKAPWEASPQSPDLKGD